MHRNRARQASSIVPDSAEAKRPRSSQFGLIEPARPVAHMVNIADLYQLFGEIAGIDVPKSVPRSIDSVAMLPYLTDPNQTSLRQWNFTQVGHGRQDRGHSVRRPQTRS